MLLPAAIAPHPTTTTALSIIELGGRIKVTLGDIDPLNKVPLKRARSRVQKGYPLRGLPNITPYELIIQPSWISFSRSATTFLSLEYWSSLGLAEGLGLRVLGLGFLLGHPFGGFGLRALRLGFTVV